MGLQLVTDPSVEPVTLAEAKLHLKAEGVDDDTLITALIRVAREAVEHRTGRALLGQAWRLTLDAFPEAIPLWRVPIVSVSSVKYFDEEGAQQTLAPAGYKLDATREPAWIVPAYGASWPSTRRDINVVEVDWVAGYHATDPTKVPAAIKQWMLIAIATLYENRESVVTGTIVAKLEYVDRLLDRYVVPRL